MCPLEVHSSVFHHILKEPVSSQILCVLCFCFERVQRNLIGQPNNHLIYIVDYRLDITLQHGTTQEKFFKHAKGLLLDTVFVTLLQFAIFYILVIQPICLLNIYFLNLKTFVNRNVTLCSGKHLHSQRSVCMIFLQEFDTSVCNFLFVYVCAVHFG